MKNKQKDKPHSKYRNIIFDLGGVLIDWQPKRIIDKVFKHFKTKPYHIAQVIETKAWQQYDRGIFTREDVAQNLSKSFDKNHIINFISNIIHHLPPHKEGLNILKLIKKRSYKTYVLSNFPQIEFEYIEQKYDFFKKFDGKIVSYHVNAIKPESEIYHALLNTYLLDPKECLFIDDRKENLEAGKALEIDGILCKDHTHALKTLKQLKVI